MKLNSKVTGGLAWGGLVLVLAVPSAEMLTKPSANAVTITSDTDAIRTASIEPTSTPAVAAPRPVTPATRPPQLAAKAAAPAAVKPLPQAEPADDPAVVEEYLASGKTLPSYISDAQPTKPTKPTESAAVAVKRVVAPPSATPPVQADGTFAGQGDLQVAAIPPAASPVPPVPYPATMRPKATATAAAPAATDGALILDEDAVARREATLRAVEPILEDEPVIIDDEQLQEWDSGSLADYLERKGLVGSAEPAPEPSREFDDDGFFLSDGPNRSSARRLIRRVDEDEVDFFFF